MNKEQKLAILSKAIDEGAQIDVSFHDCNTAQEVIDKVNKFHSSFDESFRFNKHGQHSWMGAQSEDESLGMSVYFTSEEEKQDILIDLYNPCKEREVTQEGRYWVTESSSDKYAFYISLKHSARYLVLTSELLTTSDDNTAYVTIKDIHDRQRANFLSVIKEDEAHVDGGYQCTINLGNPTGEQIGLFVYLRSENEGKKVKLRTLKAELKG